MLPDVGDITANSAQLNKFKDTLSDAAEKLVMVTFPGQVIKIDSIVNSVQFSPDRITKIKSNLNIPVPESVPPPNGDSSSSKKRKMDVEGTKVIAFVNGPVPANPNLVELIDIVKPIIRGMVENVNKVKMWISLMIPRIEDGNNFGVSVQEEVLAEVRTVEAEAASYLDAISRYYLTRGRIVSKLARYPHVEDFRLAIVDLDEKEYLNLRLSLLEIRNHYSSIHDIIVKNLEKIKRPRTTNIDHLY